MEYSLHHDVKIEHAIPPEAHVATTVTGAWIDTKDHDSLEYVIHVGVAMAGGGYDVTIEQDEDDGAGSPVGAPSAVSADETLGALPVVAIADANKVFRVGSIGKARFQRVILTETGTISAGVIGATAVLGHGKRNPQADQST